MAIFNSGTFGKISGKHGTAIAALRKDGKNILKVYNIASNPNTEGQKKQRGKFGFAVKELNCLRKLFTITFGGQYGINRAVSQAMKTCISGEINDFSIDYRLLQISKGTIQIPDVQITKTSDSVFQLNWTFSHDLFQQANDLMSVVILNNSRKDFIHLQNKARRDTKNLNFEIPEAWKADDIHAWFYLTSVSKNSFSDSCYIPLKD